MVKLFTIEGNIGAGKSTIIKIIQDHIVENKFVNFLQEPVDEWLNLKNSDGENILDLFYKNKKRWSYSFQMNAFISKQKLIEKCLKTNKLVETIISERSVFTDKECFAKQLKEDNYIDELEWELYNNWYDWLINKSNLNTSGIIYLKCSPEISYNRIKKRARKEENLIPYEYLNNIHKKHEDWLNNTKIPVLIIDVNEDFEFDLVYQKIIINKIITFLKL